MATVSVVVHGATGRMGKEVISAVCHEPGMKLVGASALDLLGDSMALPDGSGTVPYSTSIERVLDQHKPQVMVDFTTAEVCASAAVKAIERGVRPVIGTTGLTDRDLQEIDQVCKRKNVGALVAPNFALGAVLLAQLAKKVAPYFDYVELFEAHHETKLDAPSGTALALARGIAEAKTFQRPMPQREAVAGSRGADYKGISIHSTRMPGRLAYHEVLFGAKGQIFGIRHDTISRECYMPGVLMAIRQVMDLKGLVVGLENVLGL